MIRRILRALSVPITAALVPVPGSVVHARQRGGEGSAGSPGPQPTPVDVAPSLLVQKQSCADVPVPAVTNGASRIEHPGRDDRRALIGSFTGAASHVQKR
jgi:hypothetical protein